MDNERFLKEIYEPFNEAYKLIKMLKDCSSDDSEKTWNEFVALLDRFTEEHDTDIGHSMARMLTDISAYIGTINEEEKRKKEDRA
jgi:hypothetical protein